MKLCVMFFCIMVSTPAFSTPTRQTPASQPTSRPIELPTPKTEKERKVLELNLTILNCEKKAREIPIEYANKKLDLVRLLPANATKEQLESHDQELRVLFIVYRSILLVNASDLARAKRELKEIQEDLPILPKE